MKNSDHTMFVMAGAVSVLAAIVLALGMPGPVCAQQNLIVFTGYYKEGGIAYSNLFYANPDGTGRKQITDFFPYTAKNPQVSSDGNHLAFCSTLNAHRSAYYEDIFRFDLTASKLTRVTGSEYVSSKGTGSLAFNITDDISTIYIGKTVELDPSSILVTYQGSDRFYTWQEALDMIRISNVPATSIWAKAVSGRWIGGLTSVNVPRGGTATASMRLTDGNFSAYQPAWSPDGSKIAGVSEYSFYDPDAFDKYGQLQPNRSANVGFDSIAVWDSNGSLLQLLEATSDTMINTHPQFSPDGTRLAYTRGDSLVVVDASDIKGTATVLGTGGTDYSTLKNFSYLDPDWSPDGTKMACVYVNASMTQNLTANIVLIDPNGSGEMTPVTNVATNQAAGDPDFSPDGQWIAYTLATSKGATLNVTDLMSFNYTADIYIQNLSSGEQIQVTNDGVSGEPCWAFLSASPAAITPDMDDNDGDDSGGNGTPCPFSDNVADRQGIRDLRAVRELLQGKDAWLVHRYYQHAFEVAALLRNNPRLRREFQDLVFGNLHMAHDLAARGQATIDSQSLFAILAFMEKLQGRASHSLRATLTVVADELGQEAFLKKIGIRVVE